MPNSDSANAISTSGQSTLIRRVAISQPPETSWSARLPRVTADGHGRSVSAASRSCGAYLHQRPEQRHRQYSGDGSHCCREGGPDDDLHEQLGTVDAVANDHEDQIEDPLTEKDKETVEREIVGEEHRLEPRCAEADHGHP